MIMTSRQSVSETTIQADVAPGDETGIYYITICNLPFGSSWQELKDWLRQACIVDHIELFRTSTSGWIRLRGKDEFEKAWKYINSVDFKGRSIIASDRNRTESIKIKELVETSLPARNIKVSPAARLPYYQTASLSPPRHYDAQFSSTQYSAVTQGQLYKMHAYGQCAPGANYYQSPLAISHVQSVLDPYAAGVLENSWSAYGAGSPRDMPYMGRLALYEDLQYDVPYRTGPLTTMCSTIYGDMHGNATDHLVSSGGYIPTEPLKILITSISQRASPEETIAWIRRKTGPFASEIILIEVPPQSAKKNRIRGHAYIIFKSTAAAHGAVQLLHQAVFQNRQISARFTIEGVTAGEQASPVVASSCGDESKGHKSRHKELESSSHHGRGRNKSEKAERESKTKSKEKEEKVHHVIVDGSSRRLRKGS